MFFAVNHKINIELSLELAFIIKLLTHPPRLLPIMLKLLLLLNTQIRWIYLTFEKSKMSTSITKFGMENKNLRILPIVKKGN